MLDRIRSGLPAIVGLALFTAALLLLRRELSAASWHELTSGVLATPTWRLGLSVLLTAVSYAVLTGYDFLAFAYIGRSLPWTQVVLASSLAYAVANNLGVATLSGGTVRYRFYSRWGVSAAELSRIVFSYSVTFWLGWLLLGGFSLATSRLSGLAGPAGLAGPVESLRVPLGLLLAMISIAYVAAAFVRRAPFRFRSVELAWPSPRIAVLQLVVSSVDWVLASAVLYVLLPASGLTLLGFTGAFLGAQLLGLVSHVPGGVGVFEGAMVFLLKGFLGSEQVLPALLVYRAVYYLIPLTIALVVLVADELHQRRAQAARVQAVLGRLTEELMPRVLAALTFLSGAILLFSGAIPAAEARLSLLERALPLGVIEASHFLGSVVGAALLLLSQGLARRLDAAYLLTAVATTLGIVTALLKGVDYETAVGLTLLLLLLWRARPAFDRRAALFDTRFPIGWALAVAGAVGASIWLGSFVFQHVEYSNQLWWQFELHSDVSRFLRASVGSAVFVLLFAVGRLFGPAPHVLDEPTPDDLQAAAAIVDRQRYAHPNLVFLKDKALLFDEARTAFVMYGIQGRTWVALGDPVGPAERTTDLIRLFLERCDDFGGVPAFYEVRNDQLHKYADFGLTFVKLGEEARVDLTMFTLEGGRARRYRQALKYLERDGATCRVVSPQEVPALMEQFRSVSEDWLQEKAGSEKGFSLGFFSPEYLSRFPVAVVEQGGGLVAFASLWLSSQRFECSVDLMRYRHDAPKEVMEALFLHVMSWAKAQGFQWFSLGMAPLSGFEQSPVARLWNRLGMFVYKHGETIYGFQGLRTFKEKFHPTWESRYLVYPGGLRLPQILADVAALVAGGYRKILLK
ncbi:MAG: bifunctional lysylphosphatidylglycerol flippase/synthetase MprF [Acidobacteria bacterium]|nr:MAG: bifunctional lysylphosphatidylglycerol flippase/synthetase MprF [Acidobacteriota bacterium]